MTEQGRHMSVLAAQATDLESWLELRHVAIVRVEREAEDALRDRIAESSRRGRGRQ